MHPMIWKRNEDHSADLVRMGGENTTGPVWIQLRVDVIGIHILNAADLNMDGFDPTSNEMGYRTLNAQHTTSPFVIPIEGVILNHEMGVKIEIAYNQDRLEDDGATPLSLENWIQLDVVILDLKGKVNSSAQQDLAALIKTEVERYQAGMDALYYDR